jgi:hypothetical protein
MNIRIHIDRLILDGLPITHSQGPMVRAAVEAELTRLFTENGLAANLQAGVAVPSMSATAIQLASGSNPSQLGTQIAQSVYGGIGDTK